MTRQRTKAHRDSHGLEREVQKLKGRSKLFHSCCELRIPGLKPREFVLSRVWKEKKDGKIFCSYGDTDCDGVTVHSHYVRASLVVFWKFEKLPEEAGV